MRYSSKDLSIYCLSCFAYILLCYLANTLLGVQKWQKHSPYLPNWSPSIHIIHNPILPQVDVIMFMPLYKVWPELQ